MATYAGIITTSLRSSGLSYRHYPQRRKWHNYRLYPQDLHHRINHNNHRRPALQRKKTIEYVKQDNCMEDLIPADERSMRASTKAAGDANMDLCENLNATSTMGGTPYRRLEGSVYTRKVSPQTRSMSAFRVSQVPNSNRRCDGKANTYRLEKGLHDACVEQLLASFRSAALMC